MLRQGYLEFVQLTLAENRLQRQTDAPETHFFQPGFDGIIWGPWEMFDAGIFWSPG